MKEVNISPNQKSNLNINADLADLQFPMACMFNAISKYDFTRIREDYIGEAKDRTYLMMYGMLVIYQFAFFETYIDSKIWKDHEDKETVNRLMAYLHIRHAFAHSFNGKRVYESKKACEMFDEIMHSPDPLKGVLVDAKECISVNYDSIMELNTLLRTVSVSLYSVQKCPSP